MEKIEYWVWICPKCGAEFLVPEMYGFDTSGIMELTNIEPCPGGPKGEFPGGPPGPHSMSWAVDYVPDCAREVMLDDDVDVPKPQTPML